MSASSIPVIDTTTDAWGDYVACVIGDTTQSARATERGIAPATVSANVRRVRALIDAGAALPDDITAPVTVPTFTAWVRDTFGDDVADAVDVIAMATDTVVRDRDRAVRALADATARVDAADRRMATYAVMFDRVTPDGVPTFDALTDAYANAYPSTDDTDDGDTDADADADADDGDDASPDA